MNWSEFTDLGALLARVLLAFFRNFTGIVARIGIEHCPVQILTVTGRGYEALGLHIAVEVTSEAEGRHHPLGEAVSVVSFLFHIAFFVRWIAPGITLLDRQMGIDVEVNAHGLEIGRASCRE